MEMAIFRRGKPIEPIPAVEVTVESSSSTVICSDEDDSDNSDASFDYIHHPDAAFIKKRHTEPICGPTAIQKSWRIRDRMKTVSVALVVCLNVGVDPPDLVKITPCARLECWIDPTSVSPQKALEMIGANLQKQYERWQPRARYKQSLDPTVEDVKKLCTSLRRNAKEERVLFHYNGHGVPRPTVNGEIWVFNRTYTQYIPLSIYELQTWMGAPSIYVYDCSNAGLIVNLFHHYAEQHEQEMKKMLATATVGDNVVIVNQAEGGVTIRGQSPSSRSGSIPGAYKNCIQLAACSADQILPMNPQLPADLFTSCLTTPIRIALKWFTLRTQTICHQMTGDLIDKIPGQLNDRRTMLGELNWIFTAITDTIAWNTLSRDLFQKLFRQDLLVASLFRNFLLAERIMRTCDCTPMSSPSLPECYRHPMWSAWDLAVDLALQQLPNILETGAAYRNSPFFENQLTAFHVWLDNGSKDRKPPEQLPIVLQVLLSQVHRLRALELLSRFLDLGPWAVNLALSVGIFPYVLKLLQASAKELRPLLVFIWAKILAVDSTCQVDLICDQGHKYFLAVLQDQSIPSKYRTLSAFVLATIVHNFPLGQSNALQGSLISICLIQLQTPNYHLRQWLAICLGNLWQNYDKARWSGVRDLAHEKLFHLLKDDEPEVRAAAVYALGTFISSTHKDRSDHANNIDRSIAMTLLTSVGNDMSPLVRCELIAALQWMVILFEPQFCRNYQQQTSKQYTLSLERNSTNIKRVSSSSSILSMPGTVGIGSAPLFGVGSIYKNLWQGLVLLGNDPHPQVAQMAQKCINRIIKQTVQLGNHSDHSKESTSLPPSPNTRINYLSESPPVQNPLNGQPDDQIDSAPHRPVNYHRHGRMLSSAASFLSPTEPEDVSETGQRPNVPPVQLKPIVTTNFLSWSIKYFSTPTNLHRKCFDRHAGEYLERRWRDQRIESLKTNILNETFVRTTSWTDRHQQAYRTVINPIAVALSEKPTVIRLHSYEEQVAYSQFDKVIVYDWKYHRQWHHEPGILTVQQRRLPIPSEQPIFNYNTTHLLGAVAAQTPYFGSGMSGAGCISTSQPTSSSFDCLADTEQFQTSVTPSYLSNIIPITSLEFINEKDSSLIMAGYSDGTIRIWDQKHLITAWSTISELSGKRMADIRAQWSQWCGYCMVAGDYKYITIWDVHKELKLSDIPTGTDAAVTHLRISKRFPPLIVAAFKDGRIRFYDQRAPNALIQSYSHMYSDTGPYTALSIVDDDCDDLRIRFTTEKGAVGQFKYSQINRPNTPYLFQSHNHCDIHPIYDLFAASTGMDITIKRQSDFIGNGTVSPSSVATALAIGVNDVDADTKRLIRMHSETTTLSFHRYKMALAVGSIDGFINIYKLNMRGNRLY